MRQDWPPACDDEVAAHECPLANWEVSPSHSLDSVRAASRGIWLGAVCLAAPGAALGGARADCLIGARAGREDLPHGDNARSRASEPFDVAVQHRQAEKRGAGGV